MFREKALKHLKARFGGKTLDAITTAEVEAYQTSRRDEGAAPGTVNRERSVLSHLFTKSMTWGLVKANPVTGSERQTEANENPRPLTLEEEARLLACLPKGKRAWPYWRALVGLDVNTGLRLNELPSPGMAGHRSSWGHLARHTAKIGERRDGHTQRDRVSGPGVPGADGTGDLPHPTEEAD